ncbi:MAG: hypothetical protein H6925_03350 [Holosporaceae bacterium]|nr:MAG: hypothetical protein H6925_03350 [Holosporaceae bacterium]
MFFFSSLLALSAISASIIDVAIIGSGCSGLSAAYVTSEFGYKTHVFSGPHKGGDLNVNTIVGNWMGIETTTGNEIIPIIEESVADNEGKLCAQKLHRLTLPKAPCNLLTPKETPTLPEKLSLQPAQKINLFPL